MALVSKLINQGAIMETFTDKSQTRSSNSALNTVINNFPLDIKK